jgi:hypothetical protein
LLGLPLLFILKYIVPVPQEAKAVNTSPVQTTTVMPRKGYTLSRRDNNFGKSKKVVVAALQPKTTNRALHGPVFLRSTLKMPIFRTHNSVQTSNNFFTQFGYSFIQVSNRNQIITMSSFNFQQVQVTKQHLIQNDMFTPQKNIFVQNNVLKLVDIIRDDNRVSILNKILNFEGWKTVNGVETLVFNADATNGPHYKNKDMCKVVLDILDKFLKENHLSFEKGDQFAIAFRRSDSEHPNQKAQLDGVLLSKKEAHTYLLNSSAHALKTETVELERPDYITTVPEWFIYNGEQTIKCLKTLWDQGKLENSVEFFNIYEDSIRTCVLKDIENFRKTGLPDNSLDFAGQIKSSKIGGDDCERLATDLLSRPADRLIQKSCLSLVKNCVKNCHLQVAYIQQGLELYPPDSQAHANQESQSETFIFMMDKLIDIARKRVPSLESDPAFIKSYNSFIEILNGKGEYQDIIDGQAFADLKKALNDPTSHVNVVARNYKIFDDQ